MVLPLLWEEPVSNAQEAEAVANVLRPIARKKDLHLDVQHAPDGSVIAALTGLNPAEGELDLLVEPHGQGARQNGGRQCQERHIPDHVNVGVAGKVEVGVVEIKAEVVLLYAGK
jgi:hypothetical protein